MPTGQVVINNALTDLGILEQGGTPSSSDSTDALALLNRFWAAWGIDEGLIFAVQQLNFAVTQNIGSYTIGPTASAPFNVALPSRIYRAVFVTNGAGRIQMKIVGEMEYFAHPDLTASARAAEELYADFNVSASAGTATLNLYPVPNLTGCALELETAAPFVAWTLAGNYMLPQGYEDAVTEALAFRCLSRFGAAVAPQIAQTVAETGEKAEQRIREMNRINRMLTPGAEAVPMATPPEAQAKR